MISKFKGMLLFFVLAGVWLLTQPLPVFADGPIYVDADSACSSDCGGSWATAYPTLQDALAVAVSGDEIWIAEGVYYPDEGAGQTNNNRDATFSPGSGVALYGGFAATETLRTERDWVAHPTILSGDIDGDDANADGNDIAETWADIVDSNAYHVLYLDGTTTPITGTTTIDGFIITAGKADGWPDNGGGLYCAGNGSGSECSPTLAHVTFSGNYADGSGGGMYNNGSDGGKSNPTLTNVTFSGNSASQCGGGMFNNRGSPTLTHVTFSNNFGQYGGGMCNFTDSSSKLTNVTFNGNAAEEYGGGMHNLGSSPALTNVTFSGNTADHGGGVMYNQLNSNPTLTNVILWGNNEPEIYNDSGIPTISYSNIAGCGGSGDGWQSTCGADGGGNIDADPLFVDAAGGNLRLRLTSPAINAGNNAAVPPGVTTDLDGRPRIVGNAVDMGAYEVMLLLAKHVTPTLAVADQDTVTYTLVLSNAHTFTETGVILRDTLPTEVDFGAWIANPGAIVANDVITWTGDLLPTTALTFTFTAIHYGSTDPVTNTATLTKGLLHLSAHAVYNEPNYAPVLATIGDQSIAEGNELAFTATATDPNVFDVLTFTLDAGSAGSITPGGDYTWTPNEADGPGVFTATVRVSDGALDDLETFTITVYEVNAPPIAVDDSYTTTEDVTLHVAAPGVLTNDSDLEGDPLLAFLHTGPSHGALQLGTDGALVYTPTTGFSGTALFTYTLTDGYAPLGYWSFDDGANPTADGSGNGHAGALIGNTAFTTTVPISLSTGLALEFDGTGDYVTVGGPESDFDLNELTVAFWVKVGTFDRQWQSLVTKGDSAWRVHRSSWTNQISFWTDGLSPNDLVSTRAINDGQWHHVAAVYDGAATYLYIDGVLDASVAASGSVVTNTYPVMIGENAEATGRTFDGWMDDVQIYDYALSADDVKQVMGGTPGGTDEATVTLTVVPAPPDAPILLGPATRTVTATASLDLSWSAVDGASGYFVDLGGAIVDVGNTTISTTGVLAAGAYTWTVAAYDAQGGTGAYAAPWVFAVTGASQSVTLTNLVTETATPFGGGLCGSVTFTDTGTLPDSLTITYTYDFPSANHDGLLGQVRIAAEGGAGYEAAVTLCYADADLLVAGIDPAQEPNLHVYRYTGLPAWHQYSVVDPVANTVAAHGVTAFGVFGLGVEGNQPTAVGLRSFRAIRQSWSLLGLLLMGAAVDGAAILSRRKRQ